MTELPTTARFLSATPFRWLHRLLESIVISLIGELAGILFGWLITLAMATLAGWATALSGWSILLAAGFFRRRGHPLRPLAGPKSRFAQPHRRSSLRVARRRRAGEPRTAIRLWFHRPVASMMRVIHASLPGAVGCASQMPKGSGSAHVQERIDRLKAIRRRFGWSEEVCAYRLGVTYSTLNRWERGESLPKSRLVLTAIDHFIAKYQKEQSERG